MSHLKLYLFGLPRIEKDGRPIELKLRKGQALLAYLAVEEQSYSCEMLATMFWPESNHKSALASLRRVIYEVNQTLDSEIIQATAETVGLAQDAGIWLDTAVFRRRIACLNGQGPDTALPSGCLDGLIEAADLQFHTFLAGFSLPDCPEFEEWQFFQSEALCQSLLHVLQTLIARYTAQGNYEAALKYGRRWLSIEPWHEPAHRTLMILYAEMGQPALALRQYEQCRRLLYLDLDLEPEPATFELYEAIKAGWRISPK